MNVELMKKRLLATTILVGMTGSIWNAALAQDTEDDAPVALSDQQDDDDDAVVQETVVITGSRIRRNAADETLALTVVGAAEIANRGFTNAIEGLEQLTITGVGSNAQGANTQFGDNSAFVDLLGLGTNRTVVLVNGKRFVPTNQATVFVPNNEPGAQVDLTLINPALITNQEVQLTGAGAIYGADAIAGVININLETEYDGFEINAQGGFTEFFDGGNFRVNGAWGTSILGGKGHISAAAEFFNQDLVGLGGPREFSSAQFAQINNPLSLTGDDGIPDTIFQPGAGALFLPAGGLFTTADQLSGDVNNFFFPFAASQTDNTAAFDAFVGAFGASPFEVGVGGLDPNLFFGTFANAGGFFTVPNLDPATSAILPSLASPLQFAADGTLVPFDFGTGVPPLANDQLNTFFGDGFAAPELGNLLSGTERTTFNTFFTYELTDNIKYTGDFLFANVVTSSLRGIPGGLTQSPTGSTTAGNFALPIFIDENPFLSDQALDALNEVETLNGGDFFDDIGGSRVAFLSRSLLDISGGESDLSGTESRTFRSAHDLTGDFRAFNRDFYWNLGFVWGRNTTLNDGGIDILDVEFALATDVVEDADGNIVCRQQTLDAPEAIDVRNPGLSGIDISTPGGLVPTQAQIDACVPLNLFGAGAPSQEAIDFVTGSTLSENFSQQFFASASIGGTIAKLPAGEFSFNSQFEWRREALTFTPGEQFLTGAGRATSGNAAEGVLTFFEGGTEFILPVLGGDFKPIPFGAELLTFEGAARVVSRGGTGSDPTGAVGAITEAEGTIDVTFTAGGRYAPHKDITFRGTRSRAIRSASIVELFGTPQTGFVMGLSGFNPCSNLFIDAGPASGIRVTNCEAFAAANGIDLETFQPPFVTGPVATGGNPALENEVSDAWTVGVVYQPSFIPNLTLQSDYYDVTITGTLDLAFPGFDCFDQVSFPDSIVGGVPVCENFVLSVGGVIPDINPITGNPTIGSASPGGVAPSDVDFAVGFAQFSQVNQGALRTQVLRSQISYQFDINDALDVFPGSGPSFKLGDILLSGDVFYRRSFLTSSSGDFGADALETAGTPGLPSFNTRLDFVHRIGKLTHSLQWFRTASTLGSVTETDLDDQAASFFTPSFNSFNYNASYSVTDNITARFIVNNFTKAQTLPEIGIAGGGALGRTFVFSINASF